MYNKFECRLQNKLPAFVVEIKQKQTVDRKQTRNSFSDILIDILTWVQFTELRLRSELRSN